MATSTISFQGVLDSTGSCKLSFTPPSNLEGKNCYVEVKSFGLSWTTAPASPQVYDNYLLYSSWPQIQSLSVEPYGAGPFYKKVTTTAATNVSFTASGDVLTAQASSTDTINFTVNMISGSTVLVASAWSSEFAIGQYITGTNIPTNSTITALNQSALIITISNAATLTATAVSTKVYKNIVSMTTFDPKIVVGMKVTGTGIADGTTVTAVANPKVTLSSYVSSASPSLAFYANKIVYTGTPTGLDVGDVLTNANIPSGTKITAIDTATKTITMDNYLTGALTAGVVTFDQSQLSIPTTGLSVGMAVSGANIEAGTTITSILDSSTITMSRDVSAQIASGAEYIFTMPLSQMTQKLQVPLASLPYGGQSQGSPVLVNIPQGPQSVEFNVIRLDRGAVPSDAYILVLASFVDARSRPIPL